MIVFTALVVRLIAWEDRQQPIKRSRIRSSTLLPSEKPAHHMHSLQCLVGSASK